MTINFNVDPYYDNYDEDKKFHKILFRPGYAVQARELTQLQTILQQQIARQGNSLFKEGAMVVPGQISYDTSLEYVKLTAKYLTVDTKSYVTSLIGKTIVGATSGVRAKIVQTSIVTTTDPDMLYLKYINSGTDGEQKTFIADELLTTEEDNVLDERIVKILPTLNNPFGESSAASIERGVYYIHGNFVLVDSQTLVLSKFSKTTTAKVGLKIVESVVTPDKDESLLDNAQNSYNYAAPGAHRYAVDCILQARSLVSEDTTDFIQLLQVKAGKIQYMVNRTEYSVLEDTFARRTYDESGNYTIKPFSIDVREYRNNNRVSWAANTAYLQGDIVAYSGVYYTSQNNAISANVGNVTLDTNIVWSVTDVPAFNRGINTPLTIVKDPYLDTYGQATFNADGSQIFESPRSATVADNLEWESKLDIGMQPGKAYVYGYEIEKIGPNSITIDKSRTIDTVTDVLFPVDYGNYVLITNMNYVPDISSFPVVTIYNKYTDSLGAIPSGAIDVGTARIRAIEWDSGTGVGAVYKVFLFDIKMKVKPLVIDGQTYSFNYFAKQISISGGSTSVTFTADTTVVPELMSGTINVAGNSVSGQNTKFLTEFKLGDYLYFMGAPRNITSIENNLTLTLGATAGTPVTGIPVFKSTARLQNAFKTELIFSLPDYAIKTVSAISYYTSEIYKNVTTSISSGGVSTIVVNTSGGKEFANPNDVGNYTLISHLDGTTVTPTSTVRAPNNLSVTFTVNGGTYASTLFDVLTTVQKNRSIGLKSKSLTTSTIDFTTSATAQANTLWLSKPDGIRVISVKMKTGTFASPGATYSIDITSRYNFTGGQTDSYYGVSKLALKSGQAQPTAPIQVVFEYFNHGSGDFFTADSYTNYKTISKFTGYNLRDCIDFRPRVDDSATGQVLFSGNNDFLPKYGKDITLSYEYYLARKSNISIDLKGQFVISNSAPSLKPKTPSALTDAMELYQLTLEPYTFSTSSNSVFVTPIVNKRYTMKDIGKLEKRIDGLEYYTTLSMLEQGTKSMTIQDPDGLDRYKNGFIVDNFTGHTIGDVSSPDYLCSMDMEEGILRPFFSMDSVDFVETFTNNVDRKASGRNYQLTGDLITLPYTNVELINQPLASRIENINPFAVFTFIGAMTLSPPSDNWFEVNRRPDIIIDVMGNYNTIKALAEKAGVLGTVWNAWQTQWTGKTTTELEYLTAGDNWANARAISQGYTQISIEEAVKINGAGNRTAPARQIILATDTKKIGQSRTGVTTSLKETIDYQTVDDKVLSVTTIPFIRSRNILVQNRALKPNTKYYPFFDKADVLKYCDPADIITITKTNTISFDTDSNSGNDYKTAARSMGINPDFALTTGDVVTGSISGATAVVVGEQTSATGVKSIFVVNVKDTNTADGVGFKTGDLLVGSISGATATVITHTTNSYANGLMTDSHGGLNFLFNIPNSEALHFRTGKRELALLDITSYDLIQSNSSSTGIYAAEGHVETKERTVNAVRNATTVTTNANDTRTITDTSKRVVSDTGWYDPLAQTFLVDGFPETIPAGGVSEKSGSGGGCFLTSVDIFFATKDASMPVTLDIRNVVNGYPGRSILPFSQVTKTPSQVNTSANSSVATTFVFPSPVQVQNATEYCIVLTSNSTDYRVWISQMGENDIATERLIDKQPYAGVLFKSQNATAWSACQEQDLKFKINRAKFVTGKFGVVEFENSVLTDVSLDDNPIQFTTGSNKVRVMMNNHGQTTQLVSGVVTGSKITLRSSAPDAAGTISVTVGTKTVTGTSTIFTSSLEVGANIYRKDGVLIGEVLTITNNTSLQLVANAPMTYTGTWKLANPIYGISPANLFKQHSVTDVQEYDSFILTLAENATQSGYGGGEGIFASKNIHYDAIQPMVRNQVFTNTKIIPYIRGTSGKSLNGTQIPYSTAGSGWQPVSLGETNKLTWTSMIASHENASARPQDGLSIDLTTKTGQINTAVIRTDIYSDIDTLSPVIDTRGVCAILINNKINVPSASMNIPVIDDRAIVTAAPTVTFDGTAVIAIADVSENRAHITTLYAGQYITISGSSVFANNSTILVTDVSSDGSTLTVDKLMLAGTGNITIVSKDRYFSEITPAGSSSYSKYVTREISLANPSTFLKIIMSANVPTMANIEIYYKLGTVGSYEFFETVEYKKATYIFDKNNNGLYVDSEVDLVDLPEFDSVTVKLVFTSTNSCYVPQVKDLRIIACV